MSLTRDKKRVHFMTHFFNRVIEKKLFSSVEKAKDITRTAIKIKGVIIPCEKEDCNRLCIFKNDRGMLVVAPLIDTGTDFICRTIFEAEEWHRNIYKNQRRSLNRKEE